MNSVLEKIIALTRWRTPNGANPMEQLRYQVVNTILLISSSAIGLAILAHLITGKWDSIAINITVFTLSLPVFTSVYLNKINLARSYLLLYANGVIFFFSSQASFRYDFQVVFFAISLLPFVLYSSNEKWGRILGTALSIGLFFYLSFNDFQAPWHIEIPKPTWNSHCSYLLSFSIILASVGLLIHSHDLTLKYLDDERTRLINTEKLVSLGELSSSLAHELKNPLSVVISRTSLLLERMETGPISQEELDKSLRVILRTAGRIEQTIKSIQALSRDSTRDNLTPIPLKILLDDVSILLDHKIKSKEINLRIINYNNQWQIMGRESQLVQVLMNLISNAIDAVENLRDRWIEIEFKKTGSHFVIQVSDSGKGISTEVIEKIMNPFFTTKATGSGTGLGLSISRRIMRDHEGDLVYLPNLENTVFQMQFPARFLISQEPRNNKAS